MFSIRATHTGDEGIRSVAEVYIIARRLERVPHLLCKPCERRLGSFKTYKQLIYCQQFMHYFEIESEKMHRPFDVADIKNKKLA